MSGTPSFTGNARVNKFLSTSTGLYFDICRAFLHIHRSLFAYLQGSFAVWHTFFLSGTLSFTCDARGNKYLSTFGVSRHDEAHVCNGVVNRQILHTAKANTRTQYKQDTKRINVNPSAPDNFQRHTIKNNTRQIKKSTTHHHPLCTAKKQIRSEQDFVKKKTTNLSVNKT